MHLLFLLMMFYSTFTIIHLQVLTSPYSGILLYFLYDIHSKFCACIRIVDIDDLKYCIFLITSNWHCVEHVVSRDMSPLATLAPLAHLPLPLCPHIKTSFF